MNSNSKRDSKLGVYPTLTPLFGGPDKKVRSLDKDVVAVGRARGCDVALEANEVSAVHCIFYRASVGIRVRDCGSRTGTRVNGNTIRTAVLTDGDIIQIGPFSFELKVPAQFSAPPAIDPAHLERANRSRRNLTRLALQLRRKMRRVEAGQSSHAEKAVELRAKIHSYDEKVSDLEAAEMELVREREQLAKDQDAHRQRVQQLEGDIARRLEETDAEIHQRWTEFQQRCAGEEARIQAEATVAGTPSREQLEHLDARRRELEDREAHIRDHESACANMDRQVREQHGTLERERREIAEERKRLESEQKKVKAEAVKQKAAAEQAEAALHEQKAGLARMLNEAKRIQEELKRQPRIDPKAVQAAQQENQQLKETVAALEQRLEHAIDRQHVEEMLVEQDQARQSLRNEIAKLHERLQERDRQMHGFDELDGELHRLADENTQLRKLVEAHVDQPSSQDLNPELQERIESQERELAELREQVARFQGERDEAGIPMQEGKEESDLVNYEGELNRFRQQLETDRVKLNREIESLRARNTELDEATREMEMEMSRERAEMARERTRLDRMREEIKSEMERIQRDGGVRESLASFQRLRDEMKTAGGRR